MLIESIYPTKAHGAYRIAANEFSQMKKYHGTFFENLRAAADHIKRI